MVEVDFDPIFYPKSVAVVGASAQIGKWGTIVLYNIIAHGYRGKIYPINPKLDSVFGLKACPSVGEIPGRVDLAFVVIPAPRVPGVLEGFEGGVKAAVIISSGFGETEEGRELEQEVAKIARRTGVPVVGPNTMGSSAPKRA